MAGGGQYTIRVHGVLDDTQIRAQLAAIQKEMGTMAIGGKGKGKGGGAYFADVGKKAKGAGKSVTAYTQGIAKADKAQKRFGSSTLDVTKKVIQFGATTAVIRGVTSGMADMVHNVYELDGALTEFKKVSNLSGKELEKYTDQAYKVGKTVARTGTEMVQAATEFKKSGFSEKDALELGRVASMYQNVADVELTAGEAANFIVSQMKAFNIEAKDSEHIIDAVNEVSNNFAVSSADIATNIGKASAALATGNVTYEQSIGLMTAMTEITRNGAKSARGLVSIQSRYNQIIDESSSTGKKLTQWYKDHNIAIKDQNGQLRSFFEVGKDVAAIWDTLSDNEKKYYLNTQAGANQSQNLAALMRNYQTAVDATATALNSAGSAARENARYMESMEGKLSNLKSAWEDFSRKMVDSDALKNAIDGLTKFVNFLTTDFGQSMVKAAASAVLFGGAFKLLGGLASLVISPFKGATKIFSLFGKTAGKTVKPLEKVGKGMKVVKAPTVGAAKAAGKAATGFTLLGGSFSGIASILTSPAGLIASMLALGAGIMYVNTQINKAKSPEKQYENTHKKLGELQAKYDEVSDAIDRLHDKQAEGGLTSSEESQLQYLEEQKEKIQENIELYRRLEQAQKTQAARTPDLEVNKTDKVKGKQRPVTKASNLGAMEKQAQKDAGAYDLLTSKMVIFEDKAQKVAQANEKVRKAQSEVNKALDAGDVDKATKAQERLAKAESEQEQARGDLTKSYKDLKKANQELKEFYGSQDRMPKDIRESSEAVDRMVKSYQDLKKLNDKGGEKGVDFLGLSGASLDKTITDFKNLGDAIGISVDKSGKLSHVDFSTFSSSMEKMGYTTEETNSALRMLGEQHPEATFEIEGIEVAGKDVDTVMDYLDKVDGDDAEATVEINGSDVAVSDIKDINDLAARLNGEKIEPMVKAKGTELTWKEFVKLNKGAKVLDAFKPIIDLIWHGDEAEEGVENTEDSLDDLNGTTATATMKVDGSEDAAHQTGVVANALAGIAGRVAQAIVAVIGAQAGAAAVSILMGVIGALTGKTVPVNETGASPSSGRVQNLIKTIASLVGKTVTARANTVGAGAVASLRGMIAGLHDKTVSIVTKVKKIFSAKGTKHAEGGLAEVNENGFEYIRDAKTGMLRVANKGRRGTTILGEGDTVYTHGQSLRMKQEAKEDLPHFKKGKKGKKQVSRKTYNKAIKKIRDKYEKELEKLEYKADIHHWTDEKLVAEKQKLYNKYTKKIKKYNQTHTIKAKKKKDRKKKTTLGTANKHELGRAVAELEHDTAVAEIESAIEDYLGTEKNLQAALDKIDAALKAQQISADEAAELRKKAYKANVDYYMKLLEKGKMTYQQLAEIVQQYYNDGMLTEVEYYDYLEDAAEEYKSQMIDKMEEVIDAFYDTVDKYGNIIGSSFEGALGELRRLAAEGQLTAEEALKYERELYRKHLDSMFNAYQYDKKTYRDMRDMINDYYNAGKLSAEDYYDYLQDLADEAMDKEKKRLEKQKELNDNTYDLARAYVELQIDKLEKQNDELEEQNELIELQNDLEKAKSKRIRIYREGVGFVYEQDKEAIEEANKALTDYQKQQESPELKAWKQVLELFDQQEVLANIKDLENRVGHTAAELFGAMGTSTTVWTSWIKESLAESMGLDALLESMDEVEYWDDVISYLNGSGQVDSNTVQNWIDRSRYASGSLSTRAGFARVDEQGYEIGVFGKGDAVIPHNLSRNLMEWGAMSPLEYAGMASGDSYTYSFDKLVLPNVHNADDFMRELKNLPNRALQFSGGRA